MSCIIKFFRVLWGTYEVVNTVLHPTAAPSMPIFYNPVTPQWDVRGPSKKYAAGQSRKRVVKESNVTLNLSLVTSWLCEVGPCESSVLSHVK